MCRNIRTLFNFDPPATEDEIRDAAVQFARKISGFNNPSKVNEEAFNQAVDKVSSDIKGLLSSLVTDALPHNREVEAEKRRDRYAKRFGNK